MSVLEQFQTHSGLSGEFVEVICHAQGTIDYSLSLLPAGPPVFIFLAPIYIDITGYNYLVVINIKSTRCTETLPLRHTLAEGWFKT